MPTSVLFLILSVPGEAPSPETVEATVERALPYIEEKGVAWIEERDCVSCHRVSFMVWSLEAAGRHGLDVDAARVDGWREWSVQALLSPREEDDDLVGSRNLDGLAQLLLARESAGGNVLADERYTRFVDLIVDGQQEDGSWEPAGQLPGQKRPLAETTEVSTIWNALALSMSGRNDVDMVRERAVAYIDSATAGESTEWYAAMLLLENEMGEGTDAARRVDQLLQHQNDDGGWGWRVEDESDALATGQALYALAATSNGDSSTETGRAVQWLVEQQRDDGGWDVRGTKEAKRDNVEETAGYWGTCWAVLGLLEWLPTESTPDDGVGDADSF